MNYQEFIDEFTEMVQDRADELQVVKIHKVPHNNSTTMDGMTISRPDQLVSPNFYLEPYYEMFEGGVDMDVLADDIISRNKKHSFEIGPETGDFQAFDRVKASLRFRLISRSMNAELLLTLPYRPFLDLAMIYYYQPAVEEVTDVTAKVTLDTLAEWNISEEELYAIAFPQTVEKNRARLRLITDVLDDLCNGRDGAGRDEIERDDDPYGSPAIPMFVLTNEDGFYGAQCMAYPGLFRDIAEKLHADFWVLPSSIHELILMPDLHIREAGELRDLVCEINASSVPRWEILSNSVYYYSRDEDRLMLAE